MISLQQINNQHVTPIRTPSSYDTRPIKGADICSELYPNIYLCAKKKSGKTSCTFKILKECVGKRTKIIVFCSTIHKDENWIAIRKYFENKGYDITCFTSIYEDGEDRLEQLMNDIKQEAEEEEEAEREKEPETDNVDYFLQRLNELNNTRQHLDEEEKERKPRKLKYRAPDYFIVFDDLSSELKSRSLLSLLKTNRHYRSKVLLSSQYLNDILPESRKQLDLWIIFKGFTFEKIKEIYKDCDTGIPLDLFYSIYQKATKKPYSFMYIDTRTDQFRRNFNEEIMITFDGEN